MKIQTWTSFSCNNSSSYYLVAEFESEAIAKDVVGELETFLKTHAKEKDQLLDEDGDWEDPSKAQLSLGEKYDFDFGHYLGWGDCELEGDEPQLAQAEQRLLIYHGYCGGLEALWPYLETRGGKLEKEESQYGPTLAALFHFAKTPAGAEARAALTRFFGQSKDCLVDFEEPFWTGEVRLPDEPREDVFYWDDSEMGGFHMPHEVDNHEGIRNFLDGEGIADYRLVLCDEALREKFKTLSSITTCPECQGKKLKFFEAESGMPEDQMACRDCGGMFSIAGLAANQP